MGPVIVRRDVDRNRAGDPVSWRRTRIDIIRWYFSGCQSFVGERLTLVRCDVTGTVSGCDFQRRASTRMSPR
jgi:hypothetical protein